MSTKVPGRNCRQAVEPQAVEAPRSSEECIEGLGGGERSLNMARGPDSQLQIPTKMLAGPAEVRLEPSAAAHSGNLD